MYKNNSRTNFLSCSTTPKISNIKDVTFDYLNGIKNLRINDIKMSDSVMTDEIMKDVIKHIVDIIRFESNIRRGISKTYRRVAFSS